MIHVDFQIYWQNIVLRILLRTSLAVVYLVKNGIAHCDIDLFNIVICADNPVMVKLANFNNAFYSNVLENAASNKVVFTNNRDELSMKLSKTRKTLDMTKYDMFSIGRVIHHLVGHECWSVTKCNNINTNPNLSVLLKSIVRKITGPIESRPTPLQLYFAFCIEMWGNEMLTSNFSDDDLYMEFLIEKMQYPIEYLNTVTLVDSWNLDDYNDGDNYDHTDNITQIPLSTPVQQPIHPIPLLTPEPTTKKQASEFEVFFEVPLPDGTMMRTNDSIIGYIQPTETSTVTTTATTTLKTTTTTTTTMPQSM